MKLNCERSMIFYLQRFYQTLSEIKSEIENIILTGRKLVEEKSVSEPEKFSRRIDMLKELYNKVVTIILIYILNSVTFHVQLYIF